MSKRMIVTVEPEIELGFKYQGYNTVRAGVSSFDTLIRIGRRNDLFGWQIKRVHDGVILAQSRVDQPGDMSRWYAARQEAKS